MPEENDECCLTMPWTCTTSLAAWFATSSAGASCDSLEPGDCMNHRWRRHSTECREEHLRRSRRPRNASCFQFSRSTINTTEPCGSRQGRHGRFAIALGHAGVDAACQQRHCALIQAAPVTATQGSRRSLRHRGAHITGPLCRKVASNPARRGSRLRIAKATQRPAPR